MKQFFSNWIMIIMVFLLFGSTKGYSQNFNFYLGAGKLPQGFIRVQPEAVYSEQIGYGYHYQTKVSVVNQTNQQLQSYSFTTADQPFYFSVRVPEGNYKVTLTLGDLCKESETTVKAESRRLMLERVVTRPGEIISKSFIVNVRMPEIHTGGRVRLKERERDKLDWDDKLTLEFNGVRPAISKIEIEKVEDQITVYLAGNSTVVNQGAEPWASWGQMITRFFGTEVAIANHAESGLALASFRSQNRLDKIMSTIRPGDYLFIEFGHNDQKMTGPGDGPWESYSDHMRHFIREARRMQAIPVVVTPTARRRFDAEGNSVNTLDDFPAAGRRMAEEEQVPLIDLNRMTTLLYEAMGVEESKQAFVHYPANTFPGQIEALADNTHFNGYGAYQIAKCVLQGIRDNELPLADYIVDMLGYDPEKPDSVEQFWLPLSPGIELVKPDGN